MFVTFKTEIMETYINIDRIVYIERYMKDARLVPHGLNPEKGDCIVYLTDNYKILIPQDKVEEVMQQIKRITQS